MIIKSFILEKKISLMDEYFAVLFYGENIGTKDEIKNQLRSMLGEKLLVNYKVDKRIIGGLIIKIGSKMIDTSLASKINKLKVVIEGTQWK